MKQLNHKNIFCSVTYLINIKCHVDRCNNANKSKASGTKDWDIFNLRNFLVEDLHSEINTLEKANS